MPLSLRVTDETKTFNKLFSAWEMRLETHLCLSHSQELLLHSPINYMLKMMLW